jgi:hypothetical protein
MSEGRFPANVIHDGSEEVVQGFPETNGELAGMAKQVMTTKAIWGNKSITILIMVTVAVHLVSSTPQKQVRKIGMRGCRGLKREKWHGRKTKKK